MYILWLLVFGTLVLLMASTARSYWSVPVKELKKRARGGDDVAKVLYMAAGYGLSLHLLLWLLIGLASAAFLLVLFRNVSGVLAFLVVSLLIWVGLMWAPRHGFTKFGQRLARYLAPVLAKLLAYLNPLFVRVGNFVEKNRYYHTRLYDRADLLELLQQQAMQPDNRIEPRELDKAIRAVSFSDKYVRDYLTPKRVVKTVSSQDTIGPLLMDELHKSGHSRFPVIEANEDIAGTLYLRDVMRAKAGGRVRDVMRPEVSYIHEDDSLQTALQAILKTRHHLFVVVNSFEEYVGVISIEDIFEQIIGEPIMDEFDQYEDLRAVAAKEAREDHVKHAEVIPAETSEVIE